MGAAWPRARSPARWRWRACADFSRGEPSPRAPTRARAADGGDAAAADGAALSFATDVYPLLVPTCQTCHATGQQAGDTQLLFTGDRRRPTTRPSSCSSTPRRRPAAGCSSKMSGNGHQGGTVYAAGSPEYQTILHWIQQGAPP